MKAKPKGRFKKAFRIAAVFLLAAVMIFGDLVPIALTRAESEILPEPAVEEGEGLEGLFPENGEGGTETGEGLSDDANDAKKEEEAENSAALPAKAGEEEDIPGVEELENDGEGNGDEGEAAAPPAEPLFSIFSDDGEEDEDEEEEIPFAPYPCSDDFETGALSAYWDTAEENGWVVTKRFMHSGEYAAADSADGNYGPGTRVMIAKVDLRGSCKPFLSFWQLKLALQNNDYGFVDVSADEGNNWTRLYATFGQNLQWEQVQIDLSPYCTLSELQIRFRMVRSSQNPGDFGWFLDDLAIKDSPAPRQDFPFFDDVESSGGDPLWYGSRWTRTKGSAYSGDWKWSIAIDTAYQGKYYLTSAAEIDLTGVTAPRLLFWENTGSYTRRRVDVSVNNGLNWTNVWDEGTPSSSTTGWHQVDIDLAAYSGYKVRLRFSIAEETGAKWWHLDDIRVQAVAADVALDDPEEIAFNSMKLTWGASEDPDFLRYELRRSENPGVTRNSSLAASIDDRDTTAWTDTSLQMGRTYYYRLFIVKGGDLYSNGSNEVSAQTPLSLQPSYPVHEDFEAQEGEEGEDGGDLAAIEAALAARWSFGEGWGLTDARSKSGNFSIVDNPGGNEEYSGSRSLTTVVDLRQAKRPYLSFQQVKYLKNNDYGFVEVSVNGGYNWTRLYASFGENLQWEQVQIDLSPYSGQQRVWIRFRLERHSTYSPEGEFGWFLDDVVIADSPNPPQSLPFFDDGEDASGDDGEEASSDDCWYASSWARTPGSAHSGAKKWSISTNTGYQGNYYLTSAAPFELGGIFYPQLVFYENTGNYTTRRVDASVNGGLNWTNIWEQRSAYGASGWQRVQLDLSSFTGQRVLLRFSIQNETDSKWWHLDDITIQERAADVVLQQPSAVSYTSMKLAWQAAEGADFLRYELRRAENAGVSRSSSLVANIEDMALTSWTDTTLQMGRSYYYRLFVVTKGDSYSAGSNEVSAATPLPRQNVYPVLDDFEGDPASIAARWSFGDAWGLSSERARSGEFSLTDSPGGNYGDSEERILTTVVDLRLANRPYLSFWQQHYLGSGDYGFVDVSTNNGASWSTLYAASAFCESWQQVKIDLSPYSGLEQVRLRFRLKSDGSSTNDGWYLDDIAVQNAPSLLLGYPFVDDAEKGEYDDFWFASFWSRQAAGAYRGEFGRRLALNSSTKDGAYYLTSAADLDLTGAVNPRLSFWDNAGSYTKRVVQLSANGGLSWSTVWQNETTYYSSNERGWGQVSIDLSAYKGQKVRLRFTIANKEADKWWALDNISLAEPDDEAPGAVIDLRVREAEPRRVTLEWTAPGDDGPHGRAWLYDLRYATAPITEENWNTATRVSGVPNPAASGVKESFAVSGLKPGITYYFALKAADKLVQYSALSNVASCTTPPEQRTGAAAVRAVLGPRSVEGGALLPREMLAGEEFLLEIRIDDAVNLDAASYEVCYDPAVLELVYEPEDPEEEAEDPEEEGEDPEEEGEDPEEEGEDPEEEGEDPVEEAESPDKAPGVSAGKIGDAVLPLPSWHDDGEGTISLAQGDIPGADEAGIGGTLAVLHFRVIGESQGESRTQTLITLQNGVLSDKEAKEMLADWFDTSLWRVAVYSGDANGDGLVNILDVVKIKRMIVGLEAETPGADANNDGRLDALDLTTSKLIILELLR